MRTPQQRPILRRLFTSLAALALTFAACGERTDATPPPTDEPDVTQRSDIGTAELSLSLPNGSVIEKVDYTLTFSFLEDTPPTVYNTEQYTVVQHGGELTAILPCWTTPEGTGLNQVHVSAVVHIRNLPDPVTVESYSLFECVRNGDTPVNVVLNVVGALDRGFVDLAIAASGTLCASKTDFVGDGYLGVCADASCGDSESVFIFPSNCLAVSGGEPIYWVCGTPTDWTLSGSLAISRFPMPEVDGTWTFGLTALDPLHMVQADLSLTDADGYLKVWVGVARSMARVVRENGVILEREDPWTTLLDFAAELQVPPAAPGQPSPKLLVSGLNTDAGVEVSYQRAFGPCEEKPEGFALYDGYVVHDVRRSGPSTVLLYMMDQNVTWLTTVAECTAGWTAEGAPTVVCGVPTSIL